MLGLLWTRTLRSMQRSQVLIAAVLVVLLLGFLFSPTAGGKDSIALSGPWSLTARSATEGTYHFVIVSDLDKGSKVSKEGEKPKFVSYLRRGVLKRTDGKWSVTVEEEKKTLVSGLNEAGRGMELSELVVFDDKLLTFDDRTGAVFEIDEKYKLFPIALFMEGNGRVGKGQKTEWATVKDGKVYAGSFGKEYIDTKTGGVTSRNNLWVSTLTAYGVVGHEDWTDKYTVIRATTNSVFPAYQIIETIVWAPQHRKWFVLPRRVSDEPYDEKLDEKRGSNIIITCNEPITKCEKFTVGAKTPERGFSTAKFVPGTGEKLMLALKSEENEDAGTQKTLITLLDVDEQKVLIDEEEIADVKFEGLEFV